MGVYTLEQSWEILQDNFENHGNVLQNVCDNCVPILEAEKHRYVHYLVKNVKKKTAILIDKPKTEKPKTMRTPENIAVVAESVCEAPLISIHCRSQQLNISETSLRRILHTDLGIMPYKVQLVQ